MFSKTDTEGGKKYDADSLEETTAVKELIQIKTDEGIDKGELIGEIRMAQRVFRNWHWM